MPQSDAPRAPRPDGLTVNLEQSSCRGPPARGSPPGWWLDAANAGGLRPDERLESASALIDADSLGADNRGDGRVLGQIDKIDRFRQFEVQAGLEVEESLRRQPLHRQIHIAGRRLILDRRTK